MSERLAFPSPFLLRHLSSTEKKKEREREGESTEKDTKRKRIPIGSQSLVESLFPRA